LAYARSRRSSDFTEEPVVDLNKKFSELADDELVAYAADVKTAFKAIAALEVPTEAQLGEAEALADHLDAIKAEQTGRVEAATKLAARRDALRNRFAAAEDEPEDAADQKEDAADNGADEADEEKKEVGTHSEIPVPGTESARATGVVALSRKVARPVKPAVANPPIVITAAADVPDFATGSKISLEQVGKALVNRMRGFGVPSGDGMTEDLRHAGVASFRLDFPPELTIDRHSDDMEVLSYAQRESRLPGGSLVASGGWCAPSETIYDLCAGETTDGIISVPEVNVARGGIKFTKGPDFSAIYSAVGFCQTEAQAITGTAKTCVEVPCPAFTEVRLDACGICIKAPILTNAAYPELVQRYVSGSMIAHQHKMNAKVLTAMATGSTAKTVVGLGAVATDTLEAFTLYAGEVREKYRLGLSSSLEVILPFYAKDIFRADMSRRTGNDLVAVNDALIASEFSARNLAVQYAYDWQPLGNVDVWPATFEALMYPAGTWVKGTADVINLNAVYDAASLAVNEYTALFFEQGILVAQMCYESLAITIPVCTAGRTGINDLTCVTTP
jgi:hypothetical protein